MSEGMNHWVGIGNLARDAELKDAGGTTVLKGTLCCSERYKDKSGEWKDRAEFIPFSVWGKRGEAIAKFLTKGKQIAVEGSVHVSSSEKDGVKRYFTEINANKVILLGGKGQASDDDRPAPRGGGSAKHSEPRETPPIDDFPVDDDLPF